MTALIVKIDERPGRLARETASAGWPRPYPVPALRRPL